jgi:hypothetical protein
VSLPKICPSGWKETVVELADRLAALEAHLVAVLVARDLDLHPVGEGVDDRGTDAMQAAGGVVDLAPELSARMQRGHDDLERRLVLELGMRVDGNAAAVVADREHVVGFEIDLDAVGEARHRLVHRIVQDLRGKMMQGVLVRAADVHARPAPDRLQPLQDLDVLGGIALGGTGCGIEEIGGLGHGSL